MILEEIKDNYPLCGGFDCSIVYLFSSFLDRLARVVGRSISIQNEEGNVASMDVPRGGGPFLFIVER